MIKLINRSEYLDFFIDWKDRQVIKVISGVRRCGKSTMFELYRHYLQEHGVRSDQLISINFEDLEYEELTDYHKLYNYLIERIKPTCKNYIFLDEIQHVEHFEKVADSLFIKDNVDLYLTGSNAYFMSGELATVLTGRYVEMKMLPLSFKEYKEGFHMLYKDKQMTNEKLYSYYIEESSFPYTLQLHENKEQIKEYLNGIYSSILLKDIVARMKISDVMMLESVIRFLFDNIGNILSTRKISNTMLSAGRKVDVKTIEKYIKGLMDSLVIYQAKRYNIKGKQYLVTNEKYYLTDLGLRFILLGKKNVDQGHILENIVYLELIRRGYDVYVGVIPNGEVDFVAEKDGIIQYYQVSASVLDQSTLERELVSLKSINDSYPKYLLTFDELGNGNNYDGIQQKNVFQWLIDN